MTYMGLMKQVGISSVWYEGNPCNMHLLELADFVKEGVQAAGMVGFRYVNTQTRLYEKDGSESQHHTVFSTSFKK